MVLLSLQYVKMYAPFYTKRLNDTHSISMFLIILKSSIPKELNSSTNQRKTEQTQNQTTP
jgi:hypothetical protein